LKLNTNEALQWIAAVFVILGHVLNAVGPAAYPWNILVFFVGITFFLIWSLQVRNRPQTVVNVFSLGITVLGLFRALS
jgi:hypothetical protein